MMPLAQAASRCSFFLFLLQVAQRGPGRLSLRVVDPQSLQLGCGGDAAPFSDPGTGKASRRSGSCRQAPAAATWAEVRRYSYGTRRLNTSPSDQLLTLGADQDGNTVPLHGDRVVLFSGRHRTAHGLQFPSLGQLHRSYLESNSSRVTDASEWKFPLPLEE